MNSILDIAKSLAYGPTALPVSGIENVLKEYERLIKNESKFGRSARKYMKLAKAAKLALKWRTSDESNLSV